uniref:Uncharacterized protein n=1 Tax=Arundo donax TaxID=35708 RepID=A0A0A9CWU3_ARUDO
MPSPWGQAPCCRTRATTVSRCRLLL